MILVVLAFFYCQLFFGVNFLTNRACQDLGQFLFDFVREGLLIHCI